VDQVLLSQLLHWRTPEKTIRHALQLSEDELLALTSRIKTGK
jgi:hypothetical protein